ncbi:unnamed protein product [Ambrosiozyma monospora]|uniref:Unnamed protein product n=1 Tax=Ambrosiozyma monospora TaxID=43982 RepID=A0ACB5TKL4_AMBMO|nr:unnamed protein product [Ambrosiozyma monospora]
MTARVSSQVIDFQQSLPKRLKTQFKPDLTKFTKGEIIRVKLVNFMSYALAEFHFGPSMNLIIGPNGSGKSTFVCAVCIGLAGKLDYLGKASMNVDQFIKMGEKRAVIELEFKGEDDTDSFMIRRELIKKSKSNWAIDDRPCNESAVKKILKQFNIQLDNMCMFLPQDRVARFASLKPEFKLKEIEKSYGDGELYNQHIKVSEMYDKKEKMNKSLEEAQARLEVLRKTNAELNEKVATYKEYQTLEKEYKLYDESFNKVLNL